MSCGQSSGCEYRATDKDRRNLSEGELRAPLLKQIQEFRNPPTAYGSLASLFETLQSTTLKRVMGEHLARAEVGAACQKGDIVGH